VDRIALGHVVLWFSSDSSTPQMLYDHIYLNTILMKKPSGLSLVTFKQSNEFSKYFHIDSLREVGSVAPIATLL
jgi:hypothetical protein